MNRTGRQKRMALAAGAMMASLALSGCGFGDVEFNGAVFEAMGLANNGGGRSEPKLPPRAGIVLPPDAEKLPEPGSTEMVAAPPPGEAWPVDPEERKVAAAEELEQQHQEFCRDAMWRARAAGRPDTQVTGPKGPCNPSLLRSITGKDITTR